MHTYNKSTTCWLACSPSIRISILPSKTLCLWPNKRSNYWNVSVCNLNSPDSVIHFLFWNGSIFQKSEWTMEIRKIHVSFLNWPNRNSSSKVSKNREWKLSIQKNSKEVWKIRATSLSGSTDFFDWVLPKNSEPVWRTYCNSLWILFPKTWKTDSK